MSLSRRFLNLLVNESTPGFKSLRRINLNRQRLFYPDTPPRRDGSSSAAAASQGAQQAAASSEKETAIRLPGPSFTFRPGDSDEKDEWRMHCFPLSGGRRVICEDQSGRAFAIDADRLVAEILPGLRIRPKRMPLSLSIVPDDDSETGSCLFVMERFPEHGDKFEALINRFYWHRNPLPPPPFVGKTKPRDKKNGGGCPEITAYAVVGGGGGGSHICVSAEGAGTYRMDTASHTSWTQVGEWTLPFHGKVEHVPELNLWFGLSGDGDAKGKALAAADLSAMDSRPQLLGPWKELDATAPEECQDPKLVNLGSGRFCIARFFPTGAAATDGDSGGDELADKSFVVLTGVEVVPHAAGDGGNGNGEMKLQMVKHRSRRLSNTDGATIEAMF